MEQAIFQSWRSYFFSSKDFAWCQALESYSTSIKEELENVLNKHQIPAFQEVSKAQESLTQDQNWRTFVFYLYGFQDKDNCIACPNTIKALKEIPNMKTAMFSILSAGKHIPPHRGPYNGVLRCHLALEIPADSAQCRIRVHNDFRNWEQNKALIFDDSYNTKYGTIAKKPGWFYLSILKGRCRD